MVWSPFEDALRNLGLIYLLNGTKEIQSIIWKTGAGFFKVKSDILQIGSSDTVWREKYPKGNLEYNYSLVYGSWVYDT